MKGLDRPAFDTMGMSIVRNPENSVKTIHAVMDASKVGGDYYAFFQLVWHSDEAQRADKHEGNQ